MSYKHQKLLNSTFFLPLINDARTDNAKLLFENFSNFLLNKQCRMTFIVRLKCNSVYQNIVKNDVIHISNLFTHNSFTQKHATHKSTQFRIELSSS